MSNERDPLYILGYQKGFASAAVKGQQAERERIIALLEKNKKMFTTIEGGQLVDYSADAIALIKGEKE